MHRKLILLSKLASASHVQPVRALLIQKLREHGFACVTVDENDTLQNLQLAISEARKLPGFRFPPMNENESILYSEHQRQIFRALFRVATKCLGAILAETRQSSRTTSRLVELLKESESLPPFHYHLHEPFQSSQPFAWTFFNLFNYKNGLLNAHVDRSLVTVIYSPPPPSAPSSKPRSTLWIQDRHGIWRDGDREAAADDQVVVLIGEEFQDVGLAVDGLYPALHAVKVDPREGNLARPHFRADPAQSASIEPRISAALILRHDVEYLQ